MPVNLMHIKELKELTQILYFEGEYALFRAKDEQGLYRGVINRKGEIVWNDKWRHIVMRVHEYPHIFRTYNDDKPPQRLFYDVEKQAFVESPIIDEQNLSKAHKIVNNAPHIPFFKNAPGFFDYPSLRYLSDDYIGFSYEKMNWGVQDLEGNIVLPVQFDSIGSGSEPNHFAVSKDDKAGVINDKGQWVIPPVYDSIHWRWAYYVAYIKEPRRKKKAGLLDKFGNVLVPFEYDFLDPAYTEDIISAKKQGRFLFINSRNEKIKLF